MEVGHLFLKKLGKTKLRPGGVKATTQIINQCEFKDGFNVFEGACNKGVNLIKLAKKYPNVNFYGVDLDSKAINEANKEKERLGLTNVNFYVGNLSNMTFFKDDFFDFVICEAVLTMLPDNIKQKILNELYRILKYDGMMGNHCIMIKNNQDEQYILERMKVAVGIPVKPLFKENWVNLIKDSGFTVSQVYNDNLSLLSPTGLIRDEGLKGAIKIFINGHKKENVKRFKQMRKILAKELKNKINYIVVISKKKRSCEL